MYINIPDSYAIGLLWLEDDNELIYPDTGRCRGIFIFCQQKCDSGDGSFCHIFEQKHFSFCYLENAESVFEVTLITPGARDTEDGLVEE